MKEDQKRESRFIFILLILPFAVLLLHAYHFNAWSDDAFISFRYAGNFADGKGLVFNQGERVQGYSNLTWVELLAWLHEAGAGIPEAARVVSILLAAGTLWLAFLIARVLSGGSFTVAFLAPMLLSLNGSFAFWILAGLENQLFAFLLLLAVYFSIQEMRAEASCLPSSIAFGFLALTRPEGFMYFLAARGLMLLQDRFSKQALTGLLRAGFFFAVPLIPYKIWQLAYYGYPFTNTYYVKAHALSPALVHRGFVILQYYFSHYNFFVHAFILIAALLLLGRNPGVRLIVLEILAFFAFFLAVGGDALPYFRMFAWIQPLLAILASLALSGCFERLRKRLGSAQGISRMAPVFIVLLAGCLMGAAFLAPSFRGPEYEKLQVDRLNLRNWELIGNWLKKNYPETTVIAMNNVGIVPFVSGLRTIDMLGLTDGHIAHEGKTQGPGKPGHERFDAAYVISRKPDLIIPGMGWLTETPPSGAVIKRGYVSDLDLMANPQFFEFYEFQSEEIAKGLYLNFYMRRDILSGEETTGVGELAR